MYSQEITRRHRTAFVIALDCSGSMQETVRFGKELISKAEAVTRTANSLIAELIDRCRRTDGLRNYYDVAVVGYGNGEVKMMLDPAGFVSVEQLAAREVETSVTHTEYPSQGGEALLVARTQRVWIRSAAEGNTPMYEAMLRIRDMVTAWCAEPLNRESFPPVVINITDGEMSDCDENQLRDICSQIRRVKTDDGNTLLLNVHISTDSATPSMIFPTDAELSRAGRYARMLADCSSIMPEQFEQAVARNKDAGARPPFRGMGYNANIVELLSIINIGSRSVNNMQ